ncbi:hypothetical protein BJX99DRAFT_261371 [Aspergillus californicus]
MARANLPAELVLQIIECLIPSNPPVAFAPSHPITRTLLSLALVCRLTSRTARQILTKHCLYIDSANRLNQLLQQSNLPLNLPRHLSLLLSPFPVDNLDIPPTVLQVDQLSSIISNTLTRLVIDMPLRHLYPEEDINSLRPLLRAAFARMQNLEEFTSVRDELYLSITHGTQEPAIWASWSRLRRLALYNVAVESSQFLCGLRQCSNLTHLILVRPDGLAEEVSPKQMQAQSGGGLGFLPCLQHLVVVNTAPGFLQSTPFDQRTWEESFVGRLHKLKGLGGGVDGDGDTSDEESVASYLSLRVPFGRDEDEIEICQEWLAARATDGTLWGLSDELQTLLWSSSNSTV